MRFTLTILSVIISINLSAQSFGLQWVDQIVGSSSVNNVSNVNLAFDNSGNIYAAFTFIGTIDFDPSASGTYNVIGGSEDIFVAKYTKDGELTADRFSLTNADVQRVNDIVIDSQGNIYIAGTASGLVNYSPSGITANVANVGTTGTDIFLAKYTGTGQFVWVKTYGSTSNAEGLSLAIDGNDNVYLGGQFMGTMNVFVGGSTSSLTSLGLNDIFIAKFQSSGSVDWAYRFGESLDDSAQDVFFDASSQSLIITGSFTGIVDFDPGAGDEKISSVGSNRNSFLANYSAAGVYRWAIALAGGSSEGSAVTTDLSSNVYVTGYFQTASPGADFDPSPSGNALIIAKGVPDGYIAKYDASGNYIWAKSLGAGDGRGGALSITPNNQLIATGDFSGDIDFGTSNVIENVSNTSSYIARFDEDGTFLNHATIAQSNNFEHVMEGGNLLIGGRLRGTAQFDPINNDNELSAPSTYDTYFAKYDATPPTLKANNTQIPTLGADLLVSIELEDQETSVANGGASIRYRGISESSNTPFKQVILSKKAGNIFEGTIPSDDFDGLGIEFFGIATNTLGVAGATSSAITTNFSVPDGFTIPQTGTGNGSQSDYRIISVPLTLNTKTVKGIFEDDLGVLNPNEYRVFSYGDQTTELNANSSLDVGKGYWLIVAGKDRAINSGAGATLQVTKSSPFTLQLNQGWNLIGNPYNFNISWADMQTTNGALTEGLRVFKGSFVNGTQLDAMGGGFVFANDTKTIAFPVVKNTAINGGRNNDQVVPNPRAPLQPGDWEVNLNLSQSSASYNLGGLGMRTDADINYDSHDEITLPRFVDYLEINHNKTIHGYNYSMDIVPTSLEKTWEFTVESASAGFTTITWDKAALSTLNNQLYLVDVDKQWPVDMTANNEYSFETNGVRHFKAVYGNQEYVKKEIAADQFTLYGVYPNPTAGETTLSISIPDQYVGPTSVGVSLFSVLGQKVADYAYNMDETGIQEVKLFAERTSSLTPGIYIVQLQFGDIKKQTRLVIK